MPSASSGPNDRNWSAASAVPPRTETIRRFDIAKLPPSTRMLLSSDGSTTVLLRALSGLDLTIEVQSQEIHPATDIDPETRAVLRLPDHAHVLDRRSQLRDTERQALPVSANRVLSPWPSEAALTPIVTSTETPIGLSFLRDGLAQRRELIANGTSEWLDGSRCAFKEYVILGQRPLLYIHETFNPAIVPVN